ncbi:secernin-1 [Rhinatrema bivittatum]|uniref:secernin-1 n=1 Tax=Rhinatrema bivittatum TaxID=194408 RepID=UPI00112BEFCD|nr:secernin-1 [Rhinatrema bivittatum]
MPAHSLVSSDRCSRGRGQGHRCRQRRPVQGRGRPAARLFLLSRGRPSAAISRGSVQPPPPFSPARASVAGTVRAASQSLPARGAGRRRPAAGARSDSGRRGAEPSPAAPRPSRLPPDVGALVPERPALAIGPRAAAAEEAPPGPSACPSSSLFARMAVAPPSYCLVAFPPHAKAGHVVFGKNSARPRDEVQEVVYIPAAVHEPRSKVECTYITIDQVQKTHAVILSKPAWLWGAEMGANEHGVCIANVAVIGKEAAPVTEALLGMDLVRLGLERGATAKEALDAIVSLLEEHGQGGNYYEDRNSCCSFHSAFLLVDREEAWLVETVGKLWAAEKLTEGVKCVCNRLSLTTKTDAEHPELRNHAASQGWWSGGGEFNFSEVFSQAEKPTDSCAGQGILEQQEGSITMEAMIKVLRDKGSGICVDSDSFLTTASMVSILPQSGNSPCVHFFTGTPDPSRSIFKPFIFADDVKPVPKAQSPLLGDEDPVKKVPRFQEKADRRHELYRAHERARSITEEEEEQGQKLMKIMLDLERQGLEAMEDVLSCREILDPDEIADLFYDCVDTEIKFYK